MIGPETKAITQICQFVELFPFFEFLFQVGSSTSTVDQDFALNFPGVAEVIF